MAEILKGLMWSVFSEMNSVFENFSARELKMLLILYIHNLF